MLSLLAWAHLILYGEEATKKAQREGEEAVASYERQLKGETVEEVPKKIKKPKAKIIKSDRCESNVVKDIQRLSGINGDMKHGNVKKVSKCLLFRPMHDVILHIIKCFLL
jgi:hypothetical protein